MQAHQKQKSVKYTDQKQLQRGWEFFVPDITRPGLVATYLWNDSPRQKRWLKRGFMFSTCSEAHDLAVEILEIINRKV